jgi:hypothetical protein
MHGGRKRERKEGEIKGERGRKKKKREGRDIGASKRRRN